MTLERVASIADGLMTVRPGDLTFEHVRAFVDEVVTVPDDAIDPPRSRWLFRNARLVVEPSGAATTAAVTLGAAGRPGTGPSWRSSAAATSQPRRSTPSYITGASGSSG